MNDKNKKPFKISAIICIIILITFVGIGIFSALAKAFVLIRDVFNKNVALEKLNQELTEGIDSFRECNNRLMEVVCRIQDAGSDVRETADEIQRTFEELECIFLEIQDILSRYTH